MNIYTLHTFDPYKESASADLVTTEPDKIIEKAKEELKFYQAVLVEVWNDNKLINSFQEERRGKFDEEKFESNIREFFKSLTVVESKVAGTDITRSTTFPTTTTEEAAENIRNFLKSLE